MTRRRLRRIFRPDGRTLIVACDHGMISGPDRGIERLGDTLQRVIAGGVDAVMASYGTASRFEDLLADVGLVLRIDGAGTVLGPMDGPGAQFYTVEDALRLGADALCVTAFPGLTPRRGHAGSPGAGHPPGARVGPAGDGRDGARRLRQRTGVPHAA